MKTIQLLSLLTIAFVLNSCDTQPEPLTPPEETEFTLPSDVIFPDIQIDPKQDSIPLSGKEVFDYVKALFDRGIDFEWSMADDYVFWSAVIAGDSTVALGYKPADVEEIDYATLDIQSYEYQYARAYTLEFILREMRRLHPGKTFTEEDLIQKEQKLLPLMYLKIYDYEVIAKLRKLATVRYLEPHGYQVEEYGQIR